MNSHEKEALHPNRVRSAMLFSDVKENNEQRRSFQKAEPIAIEIAGL